MSINWNKKSYTKEELVDAVSRASSYAEVMRILGLRLAGSNYDTIKRAINELKLSTAHMTGQGWLKGSTHNFNKIIPLEEVLVENSTYPRYSLRVRLIKKGILKEICSICETVEWCGKKVPLVLDHINGIGDDNRLGNLRLICRNCDGQLDTFCGKNVKKKTKERRQKDRELRKQEYEESRMSEEEIKEVLEKRGLLYICPACGGPKNRKSLQCASCSGKGRAIGLPPLPKNLNCLDCGKPISTYATRCKSCVGKLQATKIEWPKPEEVLKLVQQTNFVQTGKKLGVTDNAVRKFLLRNNLLHLV